MIKIVKEILRFHKWMYYIAKKNLTLDELKGGRLSFSQFGEDILLESLFGRKKKNGFYVDVGAFNPVRSSNTYLFYKKGWRGINIEANPKHFKLFLAARQKDINLNLAVSDSKSTVEFTCDGSFSGIRDENYSSKDSNRKTATTIKVETYTLKDILEKHLPKDMSIDFISIDCEGHDEKVVKSNDWQLYRPKAVLVEQHGDGVQGAIYDHLLKHGYKFYCRIGLTLAFIAEEESSDYLPE